MSALRDTFVIARRELLERVRSKWFIVVTLLGPIAMIAMIVVPGLIARGGSAGTVVAIVDETCEAKKPGECELSDRIKDLLEGAKWTVTVDYGAKTTDAELIDRVHDKSINGFIRLPKDVLETGEIIYRGNNASSQAVQVELRPIQLIVIELRGKSRSVKAEDLAFIMKPVSIGAKMPTSGTSEGASGLATFLVGYILAFILYIIITLYGVGVMRAVVQEKVSRVMEMMVAAVKPQAMMGGKILGVGAAGLIQVAVWLAMGALTITYRAEILGWFGAKGSGPTLPPLGGTEIAVVIAFFIVGFFFYAAMYAAVGAMVSSEQDTQHVQLPVTSMLIIGIMLLQVIGNDPRSASSQGLTMVPLWSPILMPMRFVLGGATLTEIAISLGILFASTLVVTTIAAKIYRTGVLMYGKRPSFGELIRWLKY